MKNISGEIISKLKNLNLINIDYVLCEKIVLMAMDSVENFIKCEINPFIDFQLIEQIFIDIVIGEYLVLVKNSGFYEEVFIEDAIKSISEGDISITYFTEGKTTKEQKFDLLINYFLNKKSLLSDFKTVRW